jgi:hypothetical protein
MIERRSSSVCSHRTVERKTRGSSSFWKSRSDVVITQPTLLPRSVSVTPSSSLSRHTIPTAPESSMMLRSSFPLYMGFSISAVPPAFQIASMERANWGMFCR